MKRRAFLACLTGEHFDQALERAELDAEIARCDREIAEIASRRPDAQAAYLTVLGENDWQHEKRILQRMAATSGGSR